MRLPRRNPGFSKVTGIRDRQLSGTPRFALNRMAHRGLVQRVAPGVYAVAE